jgi:hypothetical protein
MQQRSDGGGTRVLSYSAGCQTQGRLAFHTDVWRQVPLRSTDFSGERVASLRPRPSLLCSKQFTTWWPCNTCYQETWQRPITVAAWSEEWTVFACSNAWIVHSKPTRGVYVIVRLFSICVVLSIDRGFATDSSPIQGVLPCMYRLRNWKSGQGPTKGCRAIDR